MRITPAYLTLVERKFGVQTRREAEAMTSHGLERNLLPHGRAVAV